MHMCVCVCADGRRVKILFPHHPSHVRVCKSDGGNVEGAAGGLLPSHPYLPHTHTHTYTPHEFIIQLTMHALTARL